MIRYLESLVGIIINGIKQEKGSNIKISDNNIYIDGKPVTPEDKAITIEVYGNIENLSVDTCMVINVHGDVVSIINGSGDVVIGGDIKGSVESSSGDITCSGVGGDVKTTSGDINIDDNESDNIPPN